MGLSFERVAIRGLTSITTLVFCSGGDIFASLLTLGGDVDGGFDEGRLRCVHHRAKATWLGYVTGTGKPAGLGSRV